MKTKKLLSENLYHFFCALCAVIMSVCVLLHNTQINEPLCVLLISVISTTAVFAAYINRKNLTAYLASAAVIILFVISLRIADVPVVKYLTATAVDLYNGAELKLYESVIIISLVSLLMSVLLSALTSFRGVRYVLLILSPALLVYYAVSGYHSDFALTFSAAGIMLCVTSEIFIRHRYRKDTDVKYTGVLSYLIPLFLIMSVSAPLIPAPSDPIDWSNLIKFADTTVGAFERLITNIKFAVNPDKSTFSIGMQGFSDAGNIFGGKLKASDDTQLSVTFVSDPRAYLYLTGNVNDTYTGKGWKQKSDKKYSESDLYLDYCETILAFERAGLTNDDLKEFTDISIAKVKYEDIITKSLFYPLKTISISDCATFDASSGSVEFSQPARRPTTYKIAYLEADYHNEKFINILKKPFSYDDNDNITYTTSLIDPPVSDSVKSILRERAEYIKEQYTSIPDFVTPRTRSLADSITKNCTCDYDKLCAIEEYLKNYTYTLNPGSIPDKEDAVDYFLFESKAGYCTYFASAMAVLARCEGIPTRYVQGFAADTMKAPVHGDVPVSSSAAHAWTEAYIEGAGWIPFEPTASYSQTRYSYHKKDVPKFNSDGYEHSVYHDDNITPDPLPTDTDPTTVRENEQTSNATKVILILSVVIPGLILLAAGYIYIKIRLFIRRYHASGETQKFMTCYKMILYLYKKSRQMRDDSETIDSFARRVSHEQSDKSISFSQVTNVFESLRYGGRDAEPSERRLCEEFLKQEFKTLKEKRGRAAVFLMFTRYCLIRINA